MDTQAFWSAVALAIATGVALWRAFVDEWKKKSVALYTVLAAGFAAFLIKVADALVK